MNSKIKNKLSFVLALLIYGAFLGLFIYLYPGSSNFDLSTLADKSELIFKGFLLTILISVILVWKVNDTFRASFDVDNYAIS